MGNIVKIMNIEYGYIGMLSSWTWWDCTCVVRVQMVGRGQMPLCNAGRYGMWFYMNATLATPFGITQWLPCPKWPCCNVLRNIQLVCNELSVASCVQVHVLGLWAVACVGSCHLFLAPVWRCDPYG